MHAYTVNDGETTSVPAFQIRWEEDDLDILETHPLAAVETGSSDGDSGGDSGGGSSGDGGSGSDNTGQEDGGDTGGDSGGSGISTGAIAGIVVGVALLVAIVLISGFLWYRKKYLKAAKSAEQDAQGEKPDTTSGPGVNPTGSPPIYPGVPQEMEAANRFPPTGVLQDDATKTATELQANRATVPISPVQQLDGSPVAHQSPGSPPYNMVSANGPVASELYSHTTRPSELGGGNHGSWGPHASELHGQHQVPELPPQATMGRVGAGSPVAEMHASTVRPIELASGNSQNVNTHS